MRYLVSSLALLLLSSPAFAQVAARRRRRWTSASRPSRCWPAPRFSPVGAGAAEASDKVRANEFRSARQARRARAFMGPRSSCLHGVRRGPGGGDLLAQLDGGLAGPGRRRDPERPFRRRRSRTSRYRRALERRIRASRRKPALRSDLLTIAFTALAFALPFRLAAIVPLTAVATKLMFRSDPRLSSIGQLLLALAFYEWVGPALFHLLSPIALQVETTAVQALLSPFGGFTRDGLTISGGANGHSIAVEEGCSAFHNLSLATLIWLSLVKLETLTMKPLHWRLLAAMAAATVALNTVRIAVMPNQKNGEDRPRDPKDEFGQGRGEGYALDSDFRSVFPGFKRGLCGCSCTTCRSRAGNGYRHRRSCDGRWSGLPRPPPSGLTLNKSLARRSLNCRKAKGEVMRYLSASLAFFVVSGAAYAAARSQSLPGRRWISELPVWDGRRSGVPRPPPSGLIRNWSLVRRRLRSRKSKGETHALSSDFPSVFYDFRRGLCGAFSGECRSGAGDGLRHRRSCDGRRSGIPRSPPSGLNRNLAKKQFDLL